MATLSRADVEHVAHLARLGLTDDELARLEGELNHILDQYAILAELDTDGIPPTAQTIEVENILRDDVVRPRCRSRRPRQCTRPRRATSSSFPPSSTGAEQPVTDPTRLLAHEMAAAPATWRGHVARADRGAPRGRRTDNRALNAWHTIDRERALSEADAADARLVAARAVGAAALDLRGRCSASRSRSRTSCPSPAGSATAGSRILEGYRAPYDAHIAERLREAGAVILGKTNMDEFAMGSSTEHSAFGPTPTRGPSTASPAAAPAARRRRSPRTTPRSIGTDTGGSIRQPAALCGMWA